jgi:hypothetical protein
VYEQIKNYERLGSSGFRSRVFDDNADGTAGYQIYVIDVDSITGKAKYKKVFLLYFTSADCGQTFYSAAFIYKCMTKCEI